MGMEPPGDPAAAGGDVSGTFGINGNRRRRVLTSRLLGDLSGDELGTVDELGEVGVRVVGNVQARQRPLLRLRLPPDLHVDHFHLLAVLQRLQETAVSLSSRPSATGWRPLVFSICDPC